MAFIDTAICSYRTYTISSVATTADALGIHTQPIPLLVSLIPTYLLLGGVLLSPLRRGGESALLLGGERDGESSYRLLRGGGDLSSRGKGARRGGGDRSSLPPGGGARRGGESSTGLRRGGEARRAAAGGESLRLGGGDAESEYRLFGGGDLLRGGGEGDLESLGDLFLRDRGGGDRESLGLLLAGLRRLRRSDPESESDSELDSLKSELDTSLDESLSELDSAALAAACCAASIFGAFCNHVLMSSVTLPIPIEVK
jgi:hypothetical protein